MQRYFSIIVLPVLLLEIINFR